MVLLPGIQEGKADFAFMDGKVQRISTRVLSASSRLTNSLITQATPRPILANSISRSMVVISKDCLTQCAAPSDNHQCTDASCSLCPGALRWRSGRDHSLCQGFAGSDCPDNFGLPQRYPQSLPGNKTGCCLWIPVCRSGRYLFFPSWSIWSVWLVDWQSMVMRM